MEEMTAMLSYEEFSGSMSVASECGPDVWLDPCNPTDPCEPDYGGICEPDCDPTENDFDCSPY